MPAAALADIIASWPLRFAPADEAPISHIAWHVCADNECGHWYVAQRLDKGWYDTMGSPVAPAVQAPLPPAPGKHHPKMIANLAHHLAAVIDGGNYAYAATLIDELADRVAVVRDKPRR